MLLAHLTLSDVRNYAVLEFDPVAGLNLVVGDNAQGKSNLLEAIAIFGTGRSFRTAHERDVIAEGMDAATITGSARTRAGAVQLACTIARAASGVRKRYTMNGALVRYARYLGRARVVTFAPRDLDVVVGPPARRRALLNAALSQERPSYYPALAQYTRILEQKRALLRSEAVDRDLLDTYDERLAHIGGGLMTARRGYVAALATAAAAAYESWAADGPLDVAYAPSVDLGTAGDDDPTHALAARLVAARSMELARRAALVGPHRDDLSLRLGTRALATFGSAGQQRAAVLALKLAEYRVCVANTDEPPLFLLDDVISELDARRRHALLSQIAGVEQAFVTATSRPEALDAAATYRVCAGSVERVA